MGSNKRGSNWTAGNVERKRHDIGGRRSIFEKSLLPTLQHHGNITRSGEPVLRTHLQRTRITEESYLRQRFTICIGIHEGTLPTNWDRSEPFNGVSSPNRWTNGTSKPRVGRIPPHVCQRETERLGRLVTHRSILS